MEPQVVETPTQRQVERDRLRVAARAADDGDPQCWIVRALVNLAEEVAEANRLVRQRERGSAHR